MASQPVKCLQMSLICLQNVSKLSPKCLQLSPKCLQNVSIETFSPYRLHQSLIPNVLPEYVECQFKKEKSVALHRF